MVMHFQLSILRAYSLVRALMVVTHLHLSLLSAQSQYEGATSADTEQSAKHTSVQVLLLRYEWQGKELCPSHSHSLS